MLVRNLLVAGPTGADRRQSLSGRGLAGEQSSRP